jgi:hypothetical protein
MAERRAGANAAPADDRFSAADTRRCGLRVPPAEPTRTIAAGLTICEAPTGSSKIDAALAYAWRLLDADVADSIVFAGRAGSRKRIA